MIKYDRTFYYCDVLVEITLFGCDEQNKIGRRTPIITGYRPNHWFGDYHTADSKTCKSFLMGNIELLEHEELEPTQTGLAEVCFCSIASNIDKLKVGFEWQMFEAPRLIGEGKVIEIWKPKYQLPNTPTACAVPKPRQDRF
ncbi:MULTISPECIES: hypothetical protein [unclassified Moraxella]|uniref:hypothetical protein n=1 Tax=unclassified Moraxella TaxID=2685852 RepID=UPI003AF4C794